MTRPRIPHRRLAALRGAARSLAALAGLGAFACSGGSGEDAGGVTYHADVRPLINSNCTGCHRPGGTAPFALESIDDVKPYQSLAVSAVESRIMPPWPVDDDCHSLAHSRGLSEVEIQTFLDWRDNDYAEGNPDDYVALDEPTLELGDADFVVAPPQAYVTDRNVVDNYRCFLIEVGFESDTYVTAMDIWPDNDELVHHAQLYDIPAASLEELQTEEANSPEPGFSCPGVPLITEQRNIFSYRPGTTALAFEPGQALRVAAGSHLMLQIHYNAAAIAADEEPAPDQTEVALWALPDGELPDKIIDRGMVNIVAGFSTIPAGATGHEQNRTLRMDQISTVGGNSLLENLGLGGGNYVPGSIIGNTPHMHQLGTRLSATLTQGAEEQCLVEVPRWDFDWQMDYLYAPDAYIPYEPGDQVTVVCEYDNSPGNQPIVDGQRRVPVDVGFGTGSLDEMCLSYVWTLHDRAEYLEAVGAP